MSHIDTTLLEQYVSMLGPNGLRESMTTFNQLMPSYMEELATMVAAKDSSSTRRQAHKMKGACRSLGFVRLAQAMEYIEKDAWHWQGVESLLMSWPDEMNQDIETATEWLNSHSSEQV